MKRSWAASVLAAIAAATFVTTPAGAFINPKFTPRDLLKQAETALVLEIKSLDANSGIAVAEVKKLLSGDANLPAAKAKEIQIDLLAMGEALSAQGKEVMQWIRAGQKEALLFSGVFDTGGEGGAEGQGEEGKPRGFLNFAGKWITLTQAESGVWEMQKIWEYLNGTWAGSTDMFLRCLNAVLADPEFDVPVAGNVQWDPNGIVRFAKAPGKVSFALAVDVAGRGQADLFVASEGGDKLFRWNGKAMEDITAKTGLATKSLSAAWGDFDGDGKLDLASWDGKALTIATQQADGTLAAKVADLGEALKDGVVSLESLDAGVAGKAGLLVGTKGWPLLLTPSGGGALAAKPLGSGEFPAKDLGQVGACIACDFDGDGLVDVLQIGSESSLFYKGSAPGTFAGAAKNTLAAGAGRIGLCLADFDGDGLQDIFIGGDAHNRLYQNLGGAKFADALGYSGSLEYISKSGGIWADSGDFNNDGRQDLMVLYGTRMAPQLFFNRGFRCFGLARDGLDLMEQKATIEAVDKNLVADASEPQQAGCLGDLNGDGALDMALVLANGDAVLFTRQVTKEAPPMGVLVSVAPSATAGPVTVSATNKDGYHLGAWHVRASGAPVVIGTRSAGPMTLQWVLPDGKKGEKKVKVKDGMVRVTIGKD